jgi:hypothetical protein
VYGPRTTTRVQCRRKGESVEPVPTEWPLHKLVAYLFDGRECDEVRAILARGQGEARGAVLEWDPLLLSSEELSAIEGAFPREEEPHPLDQSHAASVSLTLPALHPDLSVPIRADHPLVVAVASRAAYLRFDYGPWADIYLATLTRDEAAELLDDPARRVRDDSGEAELAKRIIGEDDAALRFIVPREGAPPPWMESA